MAISVTLDLYDGSAFDLPSGSVGQPVRFVRMGIVEGIDVSVVSGSPKYEAMFLAQQAIVAACAASPLTNHPEMILQRILLEALSDTSARASIIYETVIFGVGIPPSTYVLTDGAILGTEQTNMFVNADGKRQKITLNWESDTDQTGESDIPEDFVTMPALLPMRTIQVDALIYGRPTNGQGFVGSVNDADWPTVEPSFPGNPPSGPTPLPRGYWLLFEYSTRNYRISGYYTLSSKAVSRVDRDWSDGIGLIDTKTGRYVRVKSDIAAGDDLIDGLFSTPYENILTRLMDGDRACGFGRIGRYRLANFETIFGF